MPLVLEPKLQEGLEYPFLLPLGERRRAVLGVYSWAAGWVCGSFSSGDERVASVWVKATTGSSREKVSDSVPRLDCWSHRSSMEIIMFMHRAVQSVARLNWVCSAEAPSSMRSSTLNSGWRGNRMVLCHTLPLWELWVEAFLKREYLAVPQQELERFAGKRDVLGSLLITCPVRDTWRKELTILTIKHCAVTGCALRILRGALKPLNQLKCNKKRLVLWWEPQHQPPLA